MKHGDKAKAKSAKAIKASAKKTSSKTGKGREAKAGKSGGKAEVKAKSGAKAESKASKTKPSGGNGKTSRRPSSETVEFSNPVVAAAFKRAVKKYPNAFRRLTD